MVATAGWATPPSFRESGWRAAVRECRHVGEIHSGFLRCFVSSLTFVTDSGVMRMHKGRAVAAGILCAVAATVAVWSGPLFAASSALHASSQARRTRSARAIRFAERARLRSEAVPIAPDVVSRWSGRRSFLISGGVGEDLSSCSGAGKVCCMSPEGTTTSEPVLVKERRGAVSVLRLNRPEARNSLNPELLTEIGLGMIEAEDDPDVRAVVLTGTGDKAFCAGMDLRAFAEGGTGGGLAGRHAGLRAASRRARSACRSSAPPTRPPWPEDSSSCSAVTWSSPRMRPSFGATRGQAWAVRRRWRRVREHAHPARGRVGADADG